MSKIEECICIGDIECLAGEKGSANGLIFVNSGSMDEQTLTENCTSFKKWRFQPRCLRDVSKISMKCSILGQKLNFPIAVSPTGQMKMFSSGGEAEAAKAAENLGTIFTQSTWSSVSIEDVTAEAPNVPKWFQLYVLKDRELTRSLIKRAEKCGYKAIVLTVDSPVVGKRYTILRNFKPTRMITPNLDGVEGTWPFKNLRQASITWKEFHWLKSITYLPIVVKGILTPESALEAISHGASAVWVSNHGGRQFDGVLPSIYALPGVVKAIKGKCPIYFDGGIRNGGDVAKAIALGADCVFVGRPIIWGIASAGVKGAEKVLEILRDELELTMKLLGVISLKELQSVPNLVVHESNIIAKL